MESGEAGSGDQAGPSQAHELIAELYDELHELAQARLRRVGRRISVEVTDLVHEACLRLAKQQSYVDRSHLLAVGAIALKQVLLDHFRARRVRQRDAHGTLLTMTPSDEARAIEWDLVDFLDLIQDLSRIHERPAQVVEMRFLGGMTSEEIASQLEVTSRTVRNDWRFARAWLKVRFESREGARDRPHGGPGGHVARE